MFSGHSDIALSKFIHFLRYLFWAVFWKFLGHFNWLWMLNNYSKYIQREDDQKHCYFMHNSRFPFFRKRLVKGETYTRRDTVWQIFNLTAVQLSENMSLREKILILILILEVMIKYYTLNTNAHLFSILITVRNLSHPHNYIHVSHLHQTTSFKTNTTAITMMSLQSSRGHCNTITLICS